VKKSPNFIPVGNTHRYRFARFNAGISVEEIAKTDKVKPTAIEESIRLCKAQEQIYGINALETHTIEIITSAKDLEKQAIAEALTAETQVFGHTEDTAGEVIASVPNHEVRMRAMDTLTKRTSAIMARHVKGPTTNHNVNVGVGVVAGHGGGATNFEERLREVTRRRQLTTGANVLPVGDIVDVEAEESTNA
jgi:hypothetical protein